MQFDMPERRRLIQHNVNRFCTVLALIGLSLWTLIAWLLAGTTAAAVCTVAGAAWVLVIHYWGWWRIEQEYKRSVRRAA